jgi:hypothetical protein
MSNSRLLLAIVTLCSACGGSSFGAGGGGGGSSGSATEAGSTGSNAGATSSAGASSGGSAGDSSAGASAGGQSAGGTATAGAGGTSAGASGAGAGGGSSAGAAGSPGCDAEATECAKLKCQYAAAVELARVCDKGSSDQCTTSSTLPSVGGCGCPTLVNAKSEATTLAKQKYQAFQDAKCPVGPICNIACIADKSASCSAAATGNAFVCTGSPGIAVQ